MSSELRIVLESLTKQKELLEAEADAIFSELTSKGKLSYELTLVVVPYHTAACSPSSVGVSFLCSYLLRPGC